MKGQLQDMAVADIIQHNCQDRKTARVSLKNSGQKAQLFFKNGNVVHATSDGLEGEQVVFHVMHWEKGSFDLKSDVEPPAFTITRNWTSLLLEGARLLDEADSGDNVDQYISTLLSGANKNGKAVSSPHLTTRLHQTIDSPSESRVAANGESPADRSTEELLVDLAKQTEGFITGAVATLKGEKYYTHSNWDLDVSPLINQVNQFVKIVNVAVEKLGQGGLEDNLLSTEEAFVMVRFLENTDYYLMITVDKKQANLGSLRMLSRSYAEWIGKALDHQSKDKE